METIWVTQRAAAMGNWWLAVSPWQRKHSCVLSHAEVFGKTSNHPGDSAPLQPKFGTLQLRAFPKTKITFDREEISDYRWGSGKYNGGNWWGLGELCEVSRCLLWGVTVLCTMFLIPSSINVSSFHITWMDTFWTDLVCSLANSPTFFHPVI